MQTLLLRKDPLKILGAAILILFGLAKVSSAQILLQDSNPRDVRFTLGHDQTPMGQSYLTVSVPDLIRSSINSDDFETVEFSDELAGDLFYYISDGSPYVSAGRIQPADTEVATFTALSLQNRSSENFSGVLLAFDFVYNMSLLQENYQLILQYRVVGRQWKNVPGSNLSTANFSESDHDWDTFSVQLNLDQLYLRTGDELGLRWIFVNKSPDEIDPVLPIGLQRIEVVPRKAADEQIEQGTLIITEILPGSNVEGAQVEYIELFNTSERPVSLKGLELKSSAGSVVVQRDLELGPYSTALFSNIELPGLESVQAFYIYPDQFLLPESGRIEISRGGQLIARAIYEMQEEGEALELDRMAHALSGYTSLQNLIPSDEVFYSNLKGTPGKTGRSNPFYTKSLPVEGWYLISLPGALPDRLNRQSALEFFSLEGNRLAIEQIEPYSTILIHKTGNQPATLFVEPSVSLNTENELSTKLTENGFRILSFNDPHSRSLRSVRREGDKPFAPVVQIWDDQNQRFALRFSEDYLSGNWSPLVMNSDVNNVLEGVDAIGNSIAPLALEGTLPIRLFEGSGNTKVFRDEAIVGFAEIPGRLQNERFDLPKLTGSFEGDMLLPGHSMLYLTTPESKYRTNSFIHLPYEPEETGRFGLGFLPAAGTSGFASIEWDLTDQIPEEWTLKLEDLETGISVDMREVQRYRFRFTGTAEGTDRNSPFRGVSVVNPDIRNRFSVVLEPLELFADTVEEEERPGSIELRQNYPNPFNPATTITFYLPEERSVKIGVYNIVGQQVALLVDESLQSGEHSVVWDAMNNPSGIYIVQMETGSRILTRKITLIK